MGAGEGDKSTTEGIIVEGTTVISSAVGAGVSVSMELSVVEADIVMLCPPSDVDDVVVVAPTSIDVTSS